MHVALGAVVVALALDLGTRAVRVVCREFLGYDYVFSTTFLLASHTLCASGFQPEGNGSGMEKVDNA
jgi:hypothetical protein